MISIPNKKDGAQIHAINAKNTVFNQEEVKCVDELWDEYLAQGPEQSGYNFLVEKEDERVLGYACYGPRSLTSGTFDLYWIAVDPTIHRGGTGRKLLSASEEAIRKLGGRLIVLETSGLPTYEPTRKFYLATGYTLEATLRDFYSEGDDVVIFTKHL
ncbi:MAG TPA: GNAT family N-acetyltransferase [Anaerolineales bacterium]